MFRERHIVICGLLYILIYYDIGIYYEKQVYFAAPGVGHPQSLEGVMGASSNVGNTGDTGSQLYITGIILSHGPCMMILGLLECFPLGPGVTIHTSQLSAEKFL